MAESNKKQKGKVKASKKPVAKSKKKTVKKTTAKKLVKKTVAKKDVKASKKPMDLLYWYAVNFLKVGALILAIRLISVVSLANLWNLGWKIEWWSDIVPVFTFTERNVVLFSSMNAISLLATTTVLFLLFLLAYTRSLKELPKKARVKFGYYWNVLYLGLFITLIQFLVSLSLVESIFFTINWAGIVPIFVMLILATVCFLNKRIELTK